LLSFSHSSTGLASVSSYLRGFTSSVIQYTQESVGVLWF
jgi:hypothetical protein